MTGFPGRNVKNGETGGPATGAAPARARQLRARLSSGRAAIACGAAVLALAAAWMPVPLAVAAGPAPVSVTPYSGFNPLLG
ncbi:MAG: hypothetical protein WBU92_06235, partial [Candidatus Dormiibacterota bacterium]